jgi:hypothetical protein
MRLRTFLKLLHRKAHLLKFSFLLELSRLNHFLTRKLHTRRPTQWLKRQLQRHNPDETDHRPTFPPRIPSNCCESAIKQEQERQRQRERDAIWCGGGGRSTETKRYQKQQQQERQAAKKEEKSRRRSRRRKEEGEATVNWIRRLSRSTVRSLKKACHLYTEMDELREEDERARDHLQELWTSQYD